MRHHQPSRLISSALLALGTTAALIAADQPPKEKAKPQPSSAQPASPPQRGGEPTNPYAKRFQELDTNRDGYVSLDEWPLEEAKFHLVDRDKDGRLSPAELLTPNVLRRAPWEQRFHQLDSNRDGRLDGSELQHGGEKLDRRDRNRDGHVTLSEYSDGFQDVWRSSATLPERRRFERLDRNRDNRLSRIEFGGSLASFNRLDRNQDGVLSPSEWP